MLQRNGIQILLPFMLSLQCFDHMFASREWKQDVADSDGQLLAVLAKLEECRNVLAARGSCDTANLVSVAVLDLRMRLHGIGDSELKALCDEVAANAEERSRAREEEPEAERARPLLRLVK